MEELLEEIYQHLIQEFGYRNWWPAESREEVIIGAILTQNVSWRNVRSAILNLRNHKLLFMEAINKADLELIASLIKSTRYYNQKAKTLKNFTSFLFAKYSGNLDSMFSTDTEELRKELLGINGLGKETVDSILLYAGDKLIFVIDAYTRRVFSRLGITNEEMSYKDYHDFFMRNLEPDVGLYNDYHAQIVYLGHHYCKARDPKCSKCPLMQLCKFIHHNH